MNKFEFLLQLEEGLRGLPQEDIDERIEFYSEIIDDRIEEGLTEEEAVCEVGQVNKIVSQIISETSFSKIVKEKVRHKRTLRVWEIIFLILGSPLWLSLLMAAIAVALSFYISLISIIISLWSVVVSLWGCALGSIVSAVVFAVRSDAITALAMVGIGLFSAGLSILMFFACKAATKGLLLLTKKMALSIKSLFVGKKGE